MENKKYYTYTIIAACSICLIAVFFNVFTDMELPSRIMAAILGVVITATITQVLLQGQTQKEGILKKGSKVFEEKLRIYQNFLNTLYQAVKDGELTNSEKMELQFQTSLIAMHCNPKNIITVSEAVRRVVKSTCPSDRDGSVGETDLLKGLFSVVEAFRKDLYGQEESFDDSMKEITIENFSNAFSTALSGKDKKPQPQKISVDLNVASSQAEMVISSLQNAEYKAQVDNKVEASDTVESDTSVWDKAVTLWKEQGWIVEGLGSENENELTIRHTDNDNPGKISMGFYDNHYYIQAEYENDVDFSKALKWEKGGRRSRGAWWDFLPEPYFDIPEGKLFETLSSSSQLQNLLIERINYLQGIILVHHRTALWKNAIGKQDNWNLFIWYWKCLACEWQTEEEGNVYFDILPKGDGANIVEFQLGNRVRSIDMLKQTLIRIGCQDKIENIEEDCWVRIDTASFDASEIAEKAKSLMLRISG